MTAAVATDPVPLREWRAKQPGATLVSTSQVVNLGYGLRERLERIAQAEGRDATSLARLVLREYVERHEPNGHGPH